MNDNTNFYTNLTLSIITCLGAGYYTYKKYIKRSQMNKLLKTYKQSSSSELNLICKKLKSSQKQKVLINKVLAHFPSQIYPKARQICWPSQQYVCCSCPCFTIIQKTDPSTYQPYIITLPKTLINRSLLIPDTNHVDKNTYRQQKIDMSQFTKILGVGVTMGIMGELSYDHGWQVQAKIIGLSVAQIRRFLDDQHFYNTFGAVLGTVVLIVGLFWAYNTISNKNRQRRILEESLLLTRQQRF